MMMNDDYFDDGVLTLTADLLVKPEQSDLTKTLFYVKWFWSETQYFTSPAVFEREDGYAMFWSETSHCMLPIRRVELIAIKIADLVPVMIDARFF